jgi:hypothetical protein
MTSGFTTRRSALSRLGLLTISGAMRQAKGELVPQLRVDVNPLDHGSPAVLGKEILRQAERQRQPPSEIGAVLL